MASLLSAGLHEMQHMVQMLLVLLQIVFVRDKVLRDETEELLPTEPVDEMIGRANVRLSLSLSLSPLLFQLHRTLTSLVQYLAYLGTLAEIADWDADGEIHGECKAVARSLSETFEERLEAIRPRE